MEQIAALALIKQERNVVLSHFRACLRRYQPFDESRLFVAPRPRAIPVADEAVLP
jgi:hypothetical protein